MDEQKLVAFLLAARDVILTPFAYLRGSIGTVIKPALPYLQNGFVQLLLFVLLFVVLTVLLFGKGRKKRKEILDPNMEVKLNAFPLTAAFLLGMHFKSTANMLFDTNPNSVVTFFNFMNWPWEVQMYMILLIIVGTIITIFYCLFSVRFAVRFLCCLCLAALAGNLYMSVYLLIGMAADEWRGIFRLLETAARVFHSIFQGVVAGPILFATFFILFKPIVSIIERAQREREHEHWKQYGRSGSSSDSSSGSDRSGSSSGGLDAFYLPNTIHGPHNNTYVQTMITSQYAEYQCEETKELIKIPNGRISASHARSADGEYFWW